MGFLSASELQGLLELINVVLASGIVIVSCALLLYLIIYSPHNSVARSFVTLLACVLVTYFVDLAFERVLRCPLLGQGWQSRCRPRRLPCPQ